jgi:hypothetical protein
MQMANVNEVAESNEIYLLWWLNKKTGQRHFAGRAYFSEEFGDYSLLINIFEGGSHDGRRDGHYLRPVKICDNGISFRLEKAIFRNGKKTVLTIGDGFQGDGTSGEIHIHIEPLTGTEKKLILTASNNAKEKKYE